MTTPVFIALIMYLHMFLVHKLDNLHMYVWAKTYAILCYCLFYVCF